MTGKLYRIGLTGGIACGKSTVTARLKALGAQIVDADYISAQLTAENGIALDAIREAFGKHVFYLDGTLNRRALGELVFQKPEEREKLNAILHPLIEREMRRQIEKCRDAGAQVVVEGIQRLRPGVPVTAVPFDPSRKGPAQGQPAGMPH